MTIKRYLTLVAFCLFMSSLGMAQKGALLPDSLKDATVLKLSEWIHNSTHNELYYTPSLAQLKIEYVAESLDKTLKNTANRYHKFYYKSANGYYYIGDIEIKSALEPNIFGTTDTTTAEINKSISIKTLNKRPKQKIILGTRKQGIGQNAFVIKGKITESNSNKAVIGATIMVNETEKGTITNEAGEFSIKLKKGSYTLSIRSIDMEPLDVSVTVYSKDELRLQMFKKLVELNEVVISSEAKSNVNRIEMGLEQLSAAQIKTIPRMMGEPDVVKAALLLPGVQSVAEGSGQLNVRGAPADQNIFYLDGIPVYNTTHLMGFFSAFTPNAISDFTLYKSSLPSKYGGRLSSVFNIESKKGNKDKFGLRGGISPITSDVQIEGPIGKSQKLSYSTAFRSTYSTWMLKQFDVPELNESGASFNDLIFRLHYDINEKNNISTTLYYSTDFVNLNGLTSYNYGNKGASIAYTKYIRSKHKLEISGAYGGYNFNEENVQINFQEYKSAYNIGHYEARAQLSLNPTTQHQITIGANSVYYDFDLGSINAFGSQSLIKSIDMGFEQGLESGLYIEEQWKINSRLTLKAGTRLNYYQYLGPNTTYVYNNSENRKLSNITDTLTFNKNDVIYNNSAPDLRLGARFSLNELLSIKASVNSTHQYINILSNNITITPAARWKLADQNIKPMKGWHYSFGVFKNVKQQYEASIEGYYKKVNDLLDYKEGAELIFSQRPETEVLNGNLNAFGLELMLRKRAGKLTGWFNYTYARSFVKIKQINQGNSYPASFDKPHSLNLSLNYKYSTRIDFSTNVIFASGRPVTYPTTIFYQNQFPLTYYSARNEFRIPNYFRCDIGMNVEGNLKANKKFHGAWNFSVYNLLGRNNPFTVFAVPEDNRINGYQLSIFGSAIPSISYQIKLGNYAR